MRQTDDLPFELFYGVASDDFCGATGEKTAGATSLTFDTRNDKQGVIGFSNLDYMGSASGQNFSSLEEAKNYLKSDEYAKLSAMFSSLKLQ